MASPTLRPDEHPSGTLLGDSRIAYLLLKEAFRRTTGASSFAGMVITTGVLAGAIRTIAAPTLRRMEPRRPSPASTMIAVAVLAQLPRAIAGARAKGKPFTGTIIAVGLLAPAVRRAEAFTRLVQAALRRAPASLRRAFEGY